MFIAIPFFYEISLKYMRPLVLLIEDILEITLIDLLLYLPKKIYNMRPVLHAAGPGASNTGRAFSTAVSNSSIPIPPVLEHIAISQKRVFDRETLEFFCKAIGSGNQELIAQAINTSYLNIIRAQKVIVDQATLNPDKMRLYYNKYGKFLMEKPSLDHGGYI